MGYLHPIIMLTLDKVLDGLNSSDSRSNLFVDRALSSVKVFRAFILSSPAMRCLHCCLQEFWEFSHVPIAVIFPYQIIYGCHSILRRA